MDLPLAADQGNARSPHQSKQPLRPESWPGMFIPQSSSKEPVVSIDAIVKMSSVCSKCRPIREWLRNSDGDKIKNRKPKVFQHHESGLELKKRYLKSCHLCTLIWQSIVEPGNELYEKDRIRKRKTRLTQLHKAKNVKVELRHASGSLSGYSDLPLRFRLFARLEGSRRGMVGKEMEICSSFDSPGLDPKIHPHVVPYKMAGF